MNPLINQAGIGLELQGADLVIVLKKRSLGRVRTVDSAVIADAMHLPAEQCRQQYEAFLQRNRLRTPWTALVVPRESYVFRDIPMPAAVMADLRAAVELQLDGLHPFESGSVVWDCAPVSSGIAGDAAGPRGAGAASAQGQGAVAIMLDTEVERLQQWFADRGIALSQFAVSPLLLGSMASAAVRENAGSAIAAYAGARAWDCVGVGAAHPFFYAQLTASVRGAGQESEWAAALLRDVEHVQANLTQDSSARTQLLMGGAGAEAQKVIASLAGRELASFAVTALERTGLAAAAAELGLSEETRRGINLLPAENRQYIPQPVLLPTYALAALIVLLSAALGALPMVQDWRYSRQLESQIAQLQPRMATVESARKRSGAQYARLASLSGLRAEGKVPLAVMAELTQLLPNEAWLQQLQLDATTVTISGSAPSAAAVLQALASARTLQNPQFVSAISHSSVGVETFRIGAKLSVAKD